VSAVEIETAAQGYVHTSKVVRPASRLTLGETALKWYDLAPEDAPVPLAIHALARRNLRDAARAGELEISGELGFVILHRCGESFYFLLVSTWRNDNELWETVWAKDGDANHAFRAWRLEGSHRPTFCVWELGAVCHERDAFGRFLRSARGLADSEAYLRDSFAGVV
jgi:hypothetical protein